MNSKLSIIIPVYNVEKYLPKCLDSILSQTFEDFEAICIHSESPDNSMDILTEYAQEDKRIKIICQKDEGPGVARNLGLAHAKGDFISFVDGDDWIEPNTYETALQKMSDDIDIVAFGTKVVIDENLQLDEKELKSKENLQKYLMPTFEGKYELNNQTIPQVTVNIWNKIFRMDIIKKNNIIFVPNVISSEDINFLYKYLFVSRNIYFLNKTLYNYFQRPDSAVTTIKSKEDVQKIGNGCLVMEDIYKFLIAHNLLEKNSSLFLKFFYERFYHGYITCHEENMDKLFNVATNVALTIDYPLFKNDILLNELKNRNYLECVRIIKSLYSYEL